MWPLLRGFNFSVAPSADWHGPSVIVSHVWLCGSCHFFRWRPPDGKNYAFISSVLRCQKLVIKCMPSQWRAEGGGQGGGHGPRAQALEGAPAQLVGANFKKKIRPRQISKVTSLQCRINLVVKVAYMLWAPRFQEPRAPYALGGLSCLFLAEDPFLFACRFFSQGPAPCMLQH